MNSQPSTPPLPDERHGVPSASGMLRLHHCAGSHAMEQTHGARSDAAAPNPDAASGTRIHAVLAGCADAAGTLSPAEMETCEMCRQQALRVVAEWRGGRTSHTPPILERRLGLTTLGTVVDVPPPKEGRLPGAESDSGDNSKSDHNSPTPTYLFTGQADYVLVAGDTALVIDYKTGRGSSLPAQDDPQLAGLAVLVALRHQVGRVRVAIVQPWAGAPAIADYDANALALARSWLLATLEAARGATAADLRPGAHCQWCKARHACPALQTRALQEVDRLQPLSLAALPPQQQAGALWARALALTPQQHVAAYRGVELVRRYAHAIEASFRQRVEAQEIPGWALREKKGRRSIADMGLVFERCQRHGVRPADFTARCSMALGEVREALRHATGFQGKALDALHEACLVDATETSRATYELVEENGHEDSSGNGSGMPTPLLTRPREPANTPPTLPTALDDEENESHNARTNAHSQGATP